MVAVRVLPPTILSSVVPFAPMFSRRVWAHAQVLLAGSLLSPARMARLERFGGTER